VLLLLGGAAGATVATLVIQRTKESDVTRKETKRSRASILPARRHVDPPPQPATTPVVPEVDNPPQIVAAAELPAAPATRKVLPRRKTSEVARTVMEDVIEPDPMPPEPLAPREPDPTARRDPLPPWLVPPPRRNPVAVPSERAVGAGAEMRLLRSALTAANRDANPAAALALLDQYDALYPHGALRAEAMLARARSLRRLGRDNELLQLLNEADLSAMPRAAELRVLRGELLMTRAKFAEAANDFEATLRMGGADPIVERALFGRAFCRSRLGDSEGARVDLQRYLDRFPTSPRAAEVRATLGR